MRIVVLGAEFYEGDCSCRNKGELGETEVLFMNQACGQGVGSVGQIKVNWLKGAVPTRAVFIGSVGNVSFSHKCTPDKKNVKSNVLCHLYCPESSYNISIVIPNIQSESYPFKLILQPLVAAIVCGLKANLFGINFK